jgi:hypothetical protein
MASAASATSAHKTPTMAPITPDEVKHTETPEFGTCVTYYNWVVGKIANVTSSYDMMKIKATDSIWMKAVKFIGALPMAILCALYDAAKWVTRTVTCGNCCAKTEEVVKPLTSDETPKV